MMTQKAKEIKKKNPLTEVGEQILRQLFVERAVVKENDCSIKTKKGILKSENEEELFWIWIEHIKSI